MKKYYVYELINLYGTVEDVGETDNPRRRFYQHTKLKPGGGHGKYYGRQDIIMNIVAEFDTRGKARRLETKLKLEYGFDPIELNRYIKNLNRHPKTLLVYKVDGTFVGEYSSTAECAEILNLHQPSVSRVALGNRPHTKGYIIKKKENVQ